MEAYLKNSGIPFESFFSSIHKNIAATIQAHLDKTFTDLIVVGGDGTLNESMNALSDFELPVGLIQAGTGNDFSKNFYQKYDLPKQIEVAVNGTVKLIDVGVCNGRYFLNGVGIGFDGAVTRSMLENNKNNKGHLSYFSEVLKLLFKFKAPFIQVESAQQNFQDQAFLTTIGNGTTFGGGFKLTPYAVTDDGLLDVCIIKKSAVAQRIFRMLAVLQSRHPEMDICEYYKTERLFIQCNEKVDAHIDGEWLFTDRYNISIMPSVFPLRVP